MGLTIGAALSPSRAGAARPAQKQILFFTKSSGYEHSVIKTIGDRPSHAETVLTALAVEAVAGAAGAGCDRHHGYVDCGKNSR